jgi:hypothetical protein
MSVMGWRRIILFRDFVTTNLGKFHIETRGKGEGRFFRSSCTSVVPVNVLRFKNYGFVIFWRTDGIFELMILHKIVVDILKFPDGVQCLITLRAVHRNLRKMASKILNLDYKLDLSDDLFQDMCKNLPAFSRDALKKFSDNFGTIR